MNMTTSLLMAIISAVGTSSGVLIAQSTTALTEHTNVPLSALVSATVTVFLIGMWVSRKTTTFETNQAAAFRRLDAIDAKQEATAAKLETIISRLDRLELRQ